MDLELLCCACMALAVFGTAEAAPKKDVEAEASGSFKIPPLLTFENGNVGVNFLGFKASAGLGGLLTGDASHGGLQAHAETPFGQKAGAGLGGMVLGNGESTGGLYAGATAGGGVGAQAGLDGTAGPGGSAGRSYAGASAGGMSKTVIKERFGGPSAPGSVATSGSGSASGSLSGSIGFQKSVNIAAQPTQVVEIEEVQPAPPKRTYIERTVIPNYLEKTIQVPSYVEKTIRVPTVVEKKVKVPAPPTILERTVDAPSNEVNFEKSVVVEKEETPSVTVVQKTKTKLRRRPWLHFRKRFNLDSNVGSYGDVPPSAGGWGGAGGNQGTGTYTATVRKSFNPQLINDIFNIPIATLGAVSNLVGGLAGGASGSVSVSKSIEKSY